MQTLVTLTLTVCSIPDIRAVHLCFVGQRVSCWGTGTDFCSSIERIPHGKTAKPFHETGLLGRISWLSDPMGADDGSNKPHPAAKNPPDPCDDEGPDRPHWDGYPRHGPPAGTQQVTQPAGYAVAGKILLATAGALAGVLLALVAMYLYNSACRRRQRLDRSPAIAGAGGGEDRTDGASTTPRGLDPTVLRALPVVATGGGAGDCAVCLAEVRPGEKARALPRCAHLFHAECIDAWFRGNATCPLCRADVVAPDAGAEVALPEVRVDIAVVGVDGNAAAAKASMGRLPSGTDLDKTSRAFFASTRSVSF